MKSTYRELIEKLNNEKEELFVKVYKLEKYIESANYILLPGYHQFLLTEQLMGMKIYLSALTHRINYLKGNE